MDNTLVVKTNFKGSRVFVKPDGLYRNVRFDSVSEPDQDPSVRIFVRVDDSLIRIGSGRYTSSGNDTIVSFSTGLPNMPDIVDAAALGESLQLVGYNMYDLILKT